MSEKNLKIEIEEQNGTKNESKKSCLVKYMNIRLKYQIELKKR